MVLFVHSTQQDRGLNPLRNLPAINAHVATLSHARRRAAKKRGGSSSSFKTQLPFGRPKPAGQTSSNGLKSGIVRAGQPADSLDGYGVTPVLDDSTLSDHCRKTSSTVSSEEDDFALAIVQASRGNWAHDVVYDGRYDDEYEDSLVLSTSGMDEPLLSMLDPFIKLPLSLTGREKGLLHFCRCLAAHIRPS